MHSHHGPPRHRAKRGAIRRSILRMLAERPMHGYELIAEFEDRSGGRWRPSPGSVYPALAHLAGDGLVRSVEEEGRKRFELTDAGRARLEEHHDGDESMPWERSGLDRRGDLRRLRGEILGQMQQLGRFGSPEQHARAREILTRTRGELYDVLASPRADDDDTGGGDGDGAREGGGVDDVTDADGTEPV